MGTVVVLAVVVLIFVRIAEDKITDDLASRASRFQIPAVWTKESDILRPERFLCFDTNPCPSIYKRWNAGKEMTADDLNAVVATAGFGMTADGTCTRRSNDIGSTPVCSATCHDSDYDYNVTVYSPDKNEPDLVILTVRPHLPTL